MIPIPSNPILGVSLHAVGALSSSACYAPQKKVTGWSWQTYWLTQAATGFLVGGTHDEVGNATIEVYHNDRSVFTESYPLGATP